MKNKAILQEYYELCPEGSCLLEVLTEEEKRLRESGTVFLTGVCQRADQQNGNGRVYPRKVLNREVQKYQDLVNERRALGELDHPEDSVINLKNVSHLVTEIWWDNDAVMGKIQVLNTPSGQVLKELVNAGVKLGISSRGLGSVRESSGETIVEDDFQLICFDMVSEPSTPGAFMNMQEGKNKKIELTKNQVIDNCLSDILGEWE